MKTTFFNYLTKQTKRNDPIGDFARDWIADKSHPYSPRSLKTITDHLESMNACDGALAAASTAWNEWKKENVMNTMYFKALTAEEETAFRASARRNYLPFTNINGLWHPAYQQECVLINAQAATYIKDRKVEEDRPNA
jgi:uncharacterized protein YozE (UPF0346 family)